MPQYLITTVATMVGLVSELTARPFTCIPERHRRAFVSRNQRARHAAPSFRRKGIGKRGHKR